MVRVHVGRIADPLCSPGDCLAAVGGAVCIQPAHHYLTCVFRIDGKRGAVPALAASKACGESSSILLGPGNAAVNRLVTAIDVVCCIHCDCIQRIRHAGKFHPDCCCSGSACPDAGAGEPCGAGNVGRICCVTVHYC